MPHKTIWNDVGCIVEINGVISYDDVEKINSELCSSHNFINIDYFIRDLTAVQSVSISKYELEIAAYINYSASSYKKKLKGAFVIDNEKIKENVKFYIETSEKIGITWEQRIFANIHEALVWVNG